MKKWIERQNDPNAIEWKTALESKGWLTGYLNWLKGQKKHHDEFGPVGAKLRAAKLVPLFHKFTEHARWM
jgi:hypothetical protein